MPVRSSDQIRAQFIEFWLKFGGRLQPSSSLIPYNDPTVLLTTAGMQQFVPYFLGKERPAQTRYVSVQKCFRTSDIDEVGDRSHLTFFEMLGNFSIGDYFKAEVIPWSLEFSTNNLGLNKDKLWITIHETDDEANAIWLKAGIPQERIKRFGDEHNWWGPPGKSGPCGPNSELYYEQGPGFGCGFPDDPPDCDCGRLEFWNLVFMQYNQDENGVRTRLPRQNVDTGMGLERATVVANGLQSIYDTDLFQPIIKAAERIAGVQYGGGDTTTDFALRVLADHARGMTFLVLDGVVPGTGGREYVLRRIIRRAINYGQRLNIDRPFLAELVDAVVERMGQHYPDLITDAGRIKTVVSSEEELFSRTLKAGTAQLERIIAEAPADQPRISGRQVFDLYQTYGFPVELTEEILRERGLSFDRAEFDAALETERERARSASRFAQAADPVAFSDTATVTVNVRDLPPTEFLAWKDTESQSRVLAVTPTQLILEASPFYPEGGGQVGDAGVIRTPGGVFVVSDTRFDDSKHIVHYGRIAEGELGLGELARAEVDVPRRDRTRRHHTATHLLHRALKDVLGDTSQQGSYVGPDQLRFDFNYARALSREQLRDVSAIINDRSMNDLPVHWEVMPMQRARDSGAIMMFGEKYGDDVRVVSIGEYSRELCGGTHTHHSGELGAVVIANESGIGSGKRRIVAYAGQAALDHLNERLHLLETLTDRVGARTPEELEARVDSVLHELETLKREVQRRQRQQANESARHLVAHAREVRGIKIVIDSIDNATSEDLEQMVDAIRQQLPSGVVVLGSVSDGKVPFVVGVTRDLTTRVHAGKVVGEVGRKAGGGGGGGRPDFAKGGGTQPAQLGAALEHAFAIVEQALQEG